MIIEYHRPETLPEALELLARSEPVTRPLGGGTVLNQPSTEPFAVVDLQSLGLNTLTAQGSTLQIGAAVTLQQLHDSEEFLLINDVIRHEATYNFRQVATIGGTLVSANGRSPLATAMIALDAELNLSPGEKKVSLGSALALRENESENYLITHINIPLNISFAYEYIARTPADLPIVCAVVVQWPSGRTRVALGGYGRAPILALDGPSSDGAGAVARDAYREAGDQWASAAYRSDMAEILVRRCLQSFSN